MPPISVSNTSTLVNKTGSWKYIRPLYQDRVAPCNEGCPVGIDIEAYMNLLGEGRVEQARDLLLLENPMPATTGRVCYRPCESACNRRHYDGAVSIRCVERTLGDLALEGPAPSRLPRTRTETVAVVGSGPAGLACAYHLVSLGYGVTVLEAAAEPGGILRLGIPGYRLPKKILAKEIDRIRALGVDIRCGVRVGDDLPWENLAQYSAVFLATGAHHSRPLQVEGTARKGVQAGLDLLREVNLGGRPRLGERVIVVGGGNTAMDCARTALRLGSQPLVLYRRTRAEMPAIDEEVEEAEAEGIQFHFLAAPIAVCTTAGRVNGLECVRMILGAADASGRRRPIPLKDTRFFLPADHVLVAIGEEPDFDGWPEELNWRDGHLEVNSLGGTNQTRIFAGGDVVEQPRTVAHALGAGKRAAVGIDRHLRQTAGEVLERDDLTALRYGRIGNVSVTRWRGDDPVRRQGEINEVVPFEELNMDHFVPVTRSRSHRLDGDGVTRGFAEVNQGVPRETALAEARRCFNCGVCNGCEICLIFCPDLAITRRENGHGFAIDYDYCKGCGLCNAECPRGAMAMTREGL